MEYLLYLLWLIPIFISYGGIRLMVAAYRWSAKSPPIPSARVMVDGGDTVAPSSQRRRRSVGRSVGSTILMSLGMAIAIGPWWLIWAVAQELENDTWLQFGRPLRIRRRARLAGVGPSVEWSGEQVAVPQPDASVQQPLGEAWLLMARMEHASIPAFSLLSLQLAAHGAPPHLLARAHVAAQDEVRHAERCFAIARALTGREQGPAALEALRAVPRGQQSLAQLAVESLVDGCLGEGVAAALAERGSQLATHAAIAETLARIAQDERQHAELAWDVLRWCVERGGVAVAIAVGRAAAALTVPGSPLAVQLAPEVLRQWGVPDEELVRECGQRCLADVQARVRDLLSPCAAAA